MVRRLLPWLLAGVCICLCVSAQAVINVKTDLVALGIALDNAEGDGVTDDAPVLNLLAGYLNTRGGTALFPPGRYRLNSTVAFTPDAGMDIELTGENATFLGNATTLMTVTGEVELTKTLAQPAGAFDSSVVVTDATGLNVNDWIAVRSRRSSEAPANLTSDNSGGVEHLLRITAINGTTLTLDGKIPWHQKATNDVFKEIVRYGFHRFSMHGCKFELNVSTQTAMYFNYMRDMSLRDMAVTYTGANAPNSNGILFQGVHGLYCENVDFHKVQYCLWQVALNSNHTYVGCDGYGTRHTFVMSDSTHTVVRDSNGYGCVSHLDTHRGVNYMTVQGCRSVDDAGAFRDIAATAVIRDCTFTGFVNGALQVGDSSERAQGETYVLRITGTNVDLLAIDDTLRFSKDGGQTFDPDMEAAIVSIIEQSSTAATVIAYQNRGDNYWLGSSVRDIGSLWSGGPPWTVQVVAKQNFSGSVTYREYAQVHLGSHIVDNCYFDAARCASGYAAISIGARWTANVLNSTIFKPDIGVSVGGAAIFYNDTIKFIGIRIVDPRVTGFRIMNYQGLDMINCEVIGSAGTGTGMSPQEGTYTTVRMTDCRFSGLETAMDFKGDLRATRLSIEKCTNGLKIYGNNPLRFTDCRIAATTPVTRTSYSGALRDPLTITSFANPFAGNAAKREPLPYTVFLHETDGKLYSWISGTDGWLKEDGSEQDFQ